MAQEIKKLIHKTIVYCQDIEHKMKSYINITNESSKDIKDTLEFVSVSVKHCGQQGKMIDNINACLVSIKKETITKKPKHSKLMEHNCIQMNTDHK